MLQKLLLLLLAASVLFASCGKDKPKAAAVVVDADVVAAPKQDDDLAQKLAAAYPKIRCALAASVNATPSLYTDAGFADATAYLKAFDIQAKANPTWARKVTTDALAKPCVEPPAAATPTEASAPSTPGKTP
jgi:hypothetical protein